MGNMVICSRCNNSIDSTHKFCKFCGQPVEQSINQNQSQNQSYAQHVQPQSHQQGYDISGTHAQPQAYSQNQAYGGALPYQQTYGNQAPVNYGNQQYTSPYSVQQPMTFVGASAGGENQVKKKSNKKVIGIVSAIVAVAIIAVVLFVFVLPGSSPQKTVKQLEKAIMTQNEELARDCFDAATVQAMPGPILSALDMNIGSSDMMFSGFNMLDYVKLELNILQVYDEGLPKNQCVVALAGNVSLENIPKELQFLMDIADESMLNESLEPVVIAMIKEGSKWKFSKPLTEQLSDYIRPIQAKY